LKISPLPACRAYPASKPAGKLRWLNLSKHEAPEPVLATISQEHRFHHRVFLAPPWPEIYITDPGRCHGFDAAVAEYQRLLEAYPSLGYEVTILPTIGVSERADFVLNRLP
jgi:predicted ATPase